MRKLLAAGTAIALALTVVLPLSVGDAYAKNPATGIGKDGTPPGKTDDPRSNAPGQAKKDDGGGGGGNGDDDDDDNGEDDEDE